jgi:hypothetical protein
MRPASSVTHDLDRPRLAKLPPCPASPVFSWSAGGTERCGSHPRDQPLSVSVILECRSPDRGPASTATGNSVGVRAVAPLGAARRRNVVERAVPSLPRSVHGYLTKLIVYWPVLNAGYPSTCASLALVLGQGQQPRGMPKPNSPAVLTPVRGTF